MSKNQRNRQSRGQETVIKAGQKERKTGKPQFEPMTKTNPNETVSVKKALDK